MVIFCKKYIEIIRSCLKQYNFLTAKPFFLILNVGDDETQGNQHTEEVKKYCAKKKIYQI